MYIAEVSPVFPPYRGGIGTVCHQNARMLAARGHRVEVYTPRYPSLKDVQPTEQEEGFTVFRMLPWYAYGNAGLLPQLAWRLRDVDVIHLHLPFLGGELPALLAKWMYKKRIVVTYHMDLIGRDSWKYPIFRLYNKLILPLVLQHADHVMVTSFDYAHSSCIAPYMERYPEKFSELPNSVDTELYFPREKDSCLLARHYLRGDDKVIVFVGGLDDAHYFKGISYLLDAFEGMMKLQSAASHKTKLIIVGEGNLKDHYMSQAKKMGISRDVIFMGSVDAASLPDYYNLADIVVLPSIDSSEAFGIVLIEGMACAKPVITSRLPGVRTVLGYGNGEIVEPHNAEDLAVKLIAMLSDREVMKRMGLAGLEAVKEHYSHEVVGVKLEKVMKRYENSSHQ